MRSHIFHLLLVVLLLTIAILPNTILGDGTASGYIQVSLKYCLGVIGFILSLSTIWVSCFTLSSDLESYQIHMVFTKPVSRVKVWIGKWIGVVLIHGMLLLVSSGIVYGLILWQFYRKPFTADEKARIENEVLVGRRVFMPDMPDIDAKVKDEFRKRLAELKSMQAENYQNMSNSEKRKMQHELRKQIVAQLGEVKPGQTGSRYWDYKGVPKDLKTPLYFRYRIYIGKISSKDQRETEGLWSVRVLVPEKDEKEIKPGEEVKMREMFIPKSPYPEREMCGVFHEMALMPAVVDRDGTVTIAFTNFDREQKPVYFQFADGPKLLVNVGSFMESIMSPVYSKLPFMKVVAGSFMDNYLRAVFMILLKILFLAGLGCAAGGLLSMPTAVFVVMSYLLVGICASYIINIETEFGEDDDVAQYEVWHETLARVVSHTALWGIIPMQKFEVSDSVANGELIEIGFMGKTVLEFFILRGLPIFVIGILLYRRREMGTIIRK